MNGPSARIRRGRQNIRRRPATRLASPHSPGKVSTTKTRVFSDQGRARAGRRPHARVLNIRVLTLRLGSLHIDGKPTAAE
ncbi:MAG: hypothetical protein MI923_16470 [Phycisphaerales bacterium]|nr:hypothetical protein [Phycisphaerales bacterium]